MTIAQLVDPANVALASAGLSDDQLALGN